MKKSIYLIALAIVFSVAENLHAQVTADSALTL